MRKQLAHARPTMHYIRLVVFVDKQENLGMVIVKRGASNIHS